jgi:hypothetical protein
MGGRNTRRRTSGPVRGAAVTTAGGGGASRRRSAAGPRDEDLAPHDRGPVRAFVRDAVDARRRLVGLLLPVTGVVVIGAVSPASDLQRYVLFGSLPALAAVAVDAVLMMVTITRAARAAFPGEPVPGPATGWYALMRAHRARELRRPPPRVAPGPGARFPTR